MAKFFQELWKNAVSSDSYGSYAIQHLWLGLTFWTKINISKMVPSKGQPLFIENMSNVFFFPIGKYYNTWIMAGMISEQTGTGGFWNSQRSLSRLQHFLLDQVKSRFSAASSQGLV